MSYDIYLCDPVTHEPLKADSTHFIAGSMRAMGGTKELWLNITYNYGHFYYRPEVFGEGGIRSIYSKTGAESIQMLKKAISALGDDVDDSDYWHATEGNAKRALYGLCWRLQRFVLTVCGMEIERRKADGGQTD